MAEAGERSVLRQLALKLTVPGRARHLQRRRARYRALVDPDNRRPVDWDRRRELLARVKEAPSRRRDAQALLITWRLLDLRARHPEAFAGGYEPIDAGDDTCRVRRAGARCSWR